MYADGQGIEKIIKEFDAATKAIKEELLRICWHMRGGMSYSESHMLTAEERVIINKIIEGNIETTKTTGLNFF